MHDAHHKSAELPVLTRLCFSADTTLSDARFTQRPPLGHAGKWWNPMNPDEALVQVKFHSKNNRRIRIVHKDHEDCLHCDIVFDFWINVFFFYMTLYLHVHFLKCHSSQWWLEFFFFIVLYLLLYFLTLISFKIVIVCYFLIYCIAVIMLLFLFIWEKKEENITLWIKSFIK